MPLFRLDDDGLESVHRTSFSAERLMERGDLQRLLRDHIEALVPDALVLAEEFGDWEGSQRRIDLLCLDSDANLVVVELKRTDSARLADLQALRYAAMVSTMTFEEAVRAHADYLRRRGQADADARQAVLDFLGWEEPDDEAFGGDVKIVLASQDFHQEVTTTALWLIDRGIDLTCVRLTPYRLDGRVLVDVVQVIPLPEAADFQVRVRQKRQRERSGRTRAPHQRLDVTIAGETHEWLTKRAAALLVVQRLAEFGVTPEQMHASFSWRPPDHVWRTVDGVVGSEEFVRLARAAAAEEGGRAFRPKQWFCADDELLHADGRTWALVKRWGARCLEALENLAEAWPDAGIEVADARES